jgi:hypothetical protein
MELNLIQKKINEVCGCQIMFDFELAELYGIETMTLKRAVKHSIEHFPPGFMLELTAEEYKNLRCQTGTSSWGGIRYLSFATAQERIAMLSSALIGTTAIHVNTSIMRVFVLIRHAITVYGELRKSIEEFEISVDAQFSEIFQSLTKLLDKNK